MPTRFALNEFNHLTACRIIFEMPLILLRTGEDFQVLLKVDLELDAPAPRSYRTNAVISVTIEGNEITTNNVQLFEGGLESIKEKLPVGYKLKCCYGCAFGDYNVAGQGFFGTMMCFRNIKDQYSKVKDKSDYIDIMFNNERNVQETYLCSEFQERFPGTGYRG
jgi:hypothetical protein